MNHHRNTRYWRIRVQIWRADAVEPEADTHPDAPPGVPDDECTVAGLNGVPERMSELAGAYHGVPSSSLAGADLPTLSRGLSTLRVYLSDGQGRATWRRSYVAPNGDAMRLVAYVERRA